MTEENGLGVVMFQGNKKAVACSQYFSFRGFSNEECS
jgi:hypothetical protein